MASPRKSKRRATVAAPAIEEAESQRGAVSRGDSARVAIPSAGKGVGLVQAAREAIAPAFCACCCEPRKGLTPVTSQSKGATRVMRTTWLCCDCHAEGALAELGQFEIRDSGASGRPAKSKGGAAR
jgi:hypothetical protein